MTITPRRTECTEKVFRAERPKTPQFAAHSPRRNLPSVDGLEARPTLDPLARREVLELLISGALVVGVGLERLAV